MHGTLSQEKNSNVVFCREIYSSVALKLIWLAQRTCVRFYRPHLTFALLKNKFFGMNSGQNLNLMKKQLVRMIPLALAVAWFSVPLQAQEVEGTSGVEFGNIPDSLFLLKQPDVDVPYIFTNRELEISFEDGAESIIAILDYHVRLKIFDADAREASIVAIPYYFSNSMEQISNIRGRTYLPSGEEIPLRPENIRNINLNSRYNVREFTMPGIEDGAVIEYSYRIRRRYIEELPDFHLTQEAPTSIARVAITYPRYLRYEAHTENFDAEINHNIVRIDTGSVPKIFTIPQPEPIVIEEWSARDIPAVKRENYISSLDDYRGKLKFQLSEFGIPRQPLENSWELVVARIRRNQNPLDIAKLNRTAQEIGRSIAGEIGRNDPEAVQDSVFRYVNSRMNYSGSRTPFSTVLDTEVLDGTAADQAAISQTLLAMLQGAGIEAYPLLISTRETGRINRDFPSYYQFNSQIVYSEIDGRGYFMDASFSHSQPDMIPVETYNETGLLLKPDSYEWREITPVNSVFDISVVVDGELSSDGDLSGRITSTHSGYPARTIRNNSAQGEHPSGILQQLLFDGFSNISFENVEIRHLDNFKKPVEITAEFTIENYAISYTDGLRFRPMVVGYMMENPFDEHERELPVTLDAPENLDMHYRITLPRGFSVDERSDDRSFSLPGAEFEESYELSSRQMDYEYLIRIDRKNFSLDLYPQLFALYERWVELSNAAWLLESNR